MKTITKTRFFPWTTLLVGLVGFALRCWLFSDLEDGLLPANHPAGMICLIMLALVLAALWLGVQSVSGRVKYKELFPKSVTAGVGTVLAAVGMGISAFFVGGMGVLRYLVPGFGVMAAVALILTGLIRLKGQRPVWMLYGVVAVYLMMWTMACCSTWSAETQLQLYFFPLLGCCFLMIAAYYRVALCARGGRPNLYVFFAQAALFCCCLCCAGGNWLFYLSAGLWMAADYCTLPMGGRYAK